MEYSLSFLKYFKRASLFIAVIIVSASIITVPKVAFGVFIKVPRAASMLDFRNVSIISLVVFIAALKIRVSIVVIN